MLVRPVIQRHRPDVAPKRGAGLPVRRRPCGTQRGDTPDAGFTAGPLLDPELWKACSGLGVPAGSTDVTPLCGKNGGSSSAPSFVNCARNWMRSDV